MQRTLVSLCSLIVSLVVVPPVHAAIEGTVVDAATQAPLASARVSVQASATETLTNAQGEFTLPDNLGTDLVVVAAHKGYFNGSVVASDGATGVLLAIDAVAQDEDPAYQFQTPTTCATCHVMQVQEWDGSPMANAGINTWVYDIYDGTGTPNGMGGFVYVRDSPAAAENPESECASCHQPIPWIYQPFSALGDSANPTDDMLHGVSCDVCHKIADVDDTKPNYPGIHPSSATVTRPVAGVQVQYGLLGDVDYHEVGEMRGSYQPQLGATVCGTCHQDKNDHDLDGDFEDQGGVISEPTYLEWLDSPYADPESASYATCVDCHMRATGEDAACVNLPDLDRPDGDIRSHRVLGTTAGFLDNAVTMELSAEAVDGVVQVQVSITNDQTGHHVPTGVTIRNMILLVEATHMGDGSPLVHTGSEVVHDLAGVGDPADGYFGGLPGKLYAKANHGPDMGDPVFFTDATGITFDTRIPALEVDTTVYAFEPSVAGDVEVTARLIYRRSWRALVDAKMWTVDGHGEALEDVEAPHFGHLMEEASSIITVEASGESDSGSSSSTGGTGATTGDGTGSTGTVGGSEAGDGGGCSCAAGQPGAPMAWALAGVVLAWRRRPRSPSYR